MKVISHYRTRGLWWFRVFGYGIHYKDSELHYIVFSERNGFRKKLKLGKHWFGLLKPERRMVIISERRGGKIEEIRQYYSERGQ